MQLKTLMNCALLYAEYKVLHTVSHCMKSIGLGLEIKSCIGIDQK